MELQSGIGVVFPFARPWARNVYIEIIEKTTGINPAAKRDDAEVKRALYAPAKTRAILNHSSARVLNRLGRPIAVMTLEVDDPAAAAETAKKIFAVSGGLGSIGAYIVDSGDVELGIPKGFMFFVVPLEREFIPILFWPKNPKPEDLAKITPPQPWGE